jgi:hypothetical protein
MFYYCVHKCQSLDPILCQINPVHTVTPHLFSKHFNIIPHLRQSLPNDIFSSGFMTKTLISHACYMSFPSRSPWFDHPSNILWRVKVMKLSIMRLNCILTLLSLLGPNVLFLCFNWAPRHEGVLGKWRCSSTRSLTSALDGDEWSASRPGRFTPREGTPITQRIGGWVDPRAVLDAVVKRKIPTPRRESNPRTPTVQPVAQRYTDGSMDRWVDELTKC